MGSANGEWTSGDVAAVIGNYHYVVNVDPDRAVAHDPIISEEEWVAVNARLIGDLGPEPYLRNLLAVI